MTVIRPFSTSRKQRVLSENIQSFLKIVLYHPPQRLNYSEIAGFLGGAMLPTSGAGQRPEVQSEKDREPGRVPVDSSPSSAAVLNTINSRLDYLTVKLWRRFQSRQNRRTSRPTEHADHKRCHSGQTRRLHYHHYHGTRQLWQSPHGERCQSTPRKSFTHLFSHQLCLQVRRFHCLSVPETK